MIYENGEFGIFPAKLLKGLTPNQQIIMSWLVFHTNSKTGTCFPSHTTLCKETGIKSRTTIIQTLNELESLGFIKKRVRMKETGGFSSNEYSVFIKRSNPTSNSEQDLLQKMNTNHKKDNQKKYNIELFEKCWVDYERKGNKSVALRYWKKLKDVDRQSIHNNINAYKKNREYQFRKDFQGWINPTNRMWEDEIEVKSVRSI
jgi:DNA-binding transcriptional MocR family regulator